MRLIILSSVFCLLASAYGHVAQIPWDVQQDRPVAHDVAVWQGETVDLLPRLVQGIRPVAITNAPVEFRYREASLPTNTFRCVAAAANTNNGVVAVRWLPDYDAGAAWYDYQVVVGSNAANPRCFGKIIMRPTIGWHASTNPPPPVTLYPTRAEFQSASNDLASALLIESQQRASNDYSNAQSISAHAARSDNPHGITPALIGAATPEDATNIARSVSAPSGPAVSLAGTNGNEFATLEPGNVITHWRTDTVSLGFRISGSYSANGNSPGDSDFPFGFSSDGGDAWWSGYFEESGVAAVDKYFFGSLLCRWRGSISDPLALALTDEGMDPSSGVGTAAVWRASSIVTNRVANAIDSRTHELHADSFTNLIWRTVWSNGWCWAVAYTNTP